MTIQEIQDELLRLEYPFLSPDHDPDIERYFSLRNLGRARDALVLYQTRLKPRYPHEEVRALIMRAYRSRDPAYKIILAKAYQDLGERALERVKKTIVYIAEKVESYDEKDVLSTIRAADGILLVLPKDHYEAQAGLDRLFRYAENLNFHVKSMDKAVELIRAYLNQSLTVVEEAISRRENQRQRQLEEARQRQIKEDWETYARQKQQGIRVSRPHPLIDLSAIVFSPADLARIEIPAAMIKPEDQTLAYCIKYWNQINDTDFEQILYFYSKKHGTKHHAVYMAIRRGRTNQFKDDEILASVMSILVTGYYYSIRGDVYLQRKWNAVKPMLQQHHAAPVQARRIPRAAAGKPRSRRLGKPVKSAKASKASPRAALRPKLPAAKSKLRIAGSKPAETAALAGSFQVPSRPKPRIVPSLARKGRPVPAQAQLKPPAVPNSARPKAGPAPARTPPAARAVPGPAQAKAPSIPERSQPAARAVPSPAQVKAPSIPERVQPAARAVPSPAPAKARLIQAQSEKNRRLSASGVGKPGGSVSDRLRELSGRSYDVYQARFLDQARGAIRKIMGAKKRLFFTLPEAAEDLVYNFLKNHYSDPYMNWEESQEKKDLKDLGFNLDSLIPIIDECYRCL